MADRIEKLLTGQKHKLASDLNSQMNISLDSSSRPLPIGDLFETIEVDEQFEIERQSSGKYRFYGNIKSIVSNPLFNDNVKIFQRNIGGNIETKVEKVAPNKIIEQDGWFGYFDDDSDTAQEYIEDADDFNDNKSTLCELFNFDPGPDRLKFDDPDGLPNYLIKITYPSVSGDVVLVDNSQGVSLKDGISIISVEEKIINERSYTVFKTPINHGLSKGDVVRFFKVGGDITYDANRENDYEVVELGDSGGKNRGRNFIVEIDYNVSDIENIIDKKVATFKRVVNQTTSEYYLRRFKSLTTDLKDYDMFPASFATTAYGDEEVGFNFTTDVDVSGLLDIKGRPLSELYLSVIKIDTDNDLTDYKDLYWLDKQENATSGIIPNNLVGRFWTHIQGGFKTENDVDVNYNVRAISSDLDVDGSGNPTTPIYPQTHFGEIDDGIDESDEYFDGDISEYNSEELNERILEPIWHRINTVYREYNSAIEKSVDKNNLSEGYIYRPHYRIKIRDFSSYIETGDSKKVINIPDYATLVYSGLTVPSDVDIDSTLPPELRVYEKDEPTAIYKWRDFLSIGFFDQLGRGVEYPFKSGSHYMYLDFNFFLERQDPPCEVVQTVEDMVITIPPITTSDKQEAARFVNLTKDPRFFDFEVYEDLTENNNTLPDDNDVGDDGSVSGTTLNSGLLVGKKLNVSVTLVDILGEYPLGSRLIKGDCVELPTIERIPIDDVC